MTKWMKFIAIVEMVGGIVGILLGIGLAVKFFEMPASLNGLLLMILFSCPFCAGLFLWKKHRLGYPLTVIVQALQIPVFSSACFSYLFSSGLFFAITIGAMGLNFEFNIIGSKFNIAVNQNDPFSIGINFIPIIFLWQLYKHRDYQIQDKITN